MKKEPEGIAVSEPLRMAIATPIPLRSWVAHFGKLAGISGFQSDAEWRKLAPRSADEWLALYNEFMQRPVQR